jgi:hypothetical protein
MKRFRALDRNVYATAYRSREAIRTGDGWYQAFPQDIVDNDGYMPLTMAVLALGGPGQAMRGTAGDAYSGPIDPAEGQTDRRACRSGCEDLSGAASRRHAGKPSFAKGRRLHFPNAGISGWTILQPLLTAAAHMRLARISIAGRVSAQLPCLRGIHEPVPSIIVCHNHVCLDTGTIGLCADPGQ